MDWLTSLIDGLGSAISGAFEKPLEQRLRLDMGRLSEMDIRGNLWSDSGFLHDDWRDGD